MATKKDSLFKRLQSYSPRPKKSAKEDFFTEALVYVLNKDKSLLKNYVLFLLLKFENQEDCNWKKDKINQEELDNIERFEIETQVVKSLQEGDKEPRFIRPDVEISTVPQKNTNQSIRILCEHKLESDERSGQLADYSKVLAQEQSSSGTQELNLVIYITYSGYLSKHTKSFFKNRKHNFLNLRWQEVYDFLDDYYAELGKREDHSDTEIVQNLLRYMEELKMVQPKQFDPMQLATISKFQETAQDLDSIIRGRAWTIFDSIKKPSGNMQIRADNGWDITQMLRWQYSKPIKKGKLRVEFGFTFCDQDPPPVQLKSGYPSLRGGQ